jgi:hypothetical protein
VLLAIKSALWNTGSPIFRGAMTVSSRKEKCAAQIPSIRIWISRMIDTSQRHGADHRGKSDNGVTRAISLRSGALPASMAKSFSRTSVAAAFVSFARVEAARKEMLALTT